MPNPTTAPSAWATWTPIYYTHTVTDPTHFPNDSSIAARTSAQLRNKFPIGYNGTPKIHSKNCPFSFDDNHPDLIHSTDPIHHSKRHPDPISCFAAIHFPDRQTETRTHTDQQMG